MEIKDIWEGTVDEIIKHFCASTQSPMDCNFIGTKTEYENVPVKEQLENIRNLDVNNVGKIFYKKRISFDKICEWEIISQYVRILK